MASRRAALISFAAVVIVGALAAFLPALLKQRHVIVASPAAPPLLDITPVLVRTGQSVCIADVTLDPQAGRVRFALVQAPPPATRLTARLTVTGSAGYRFRTDVTVPTATVTSTPTAFVGGATPFDVPLARRPPHQQTGTVCLTYLGPAGIRLVGSLEPRSLASAPATLDGRPIAARVALILLAARPRNLLARVPQILAHASAFRPGWLGRPVLWALLIAVAIGVPAGIASVLASAQPRPTGDAPASGAAAGNGKSTP